MSVISTRMNRGQWTGTQASRLQRRVVQRRGAPANQQFDLPALFRVEATLMQAGTPAFQSVGETPSLDSLFTNFPSLELPTFPFTAPITP